jgi:flagellar motor switch protein FliM
MADEILSQAEVESLLTTMESQEAKPQTVVSGGPARQVRAREKISPYDFKRPERVGKEQMRSLQSLHEGFGRNFGAALSALLRTIVEVKLTSVDQLTYSEFVFSLENPTCFNLLKAAPLEGHLILDINPSILYPIIDRLLGGGKEAPTVTRRPLTEIELRLVGRITSLFLQELKHAWKDVLPLQLEVERVESNPQLVQIVPPNEVVVLISFELTLGDVRGMLNLCIPFNAIERHSSKLAANTWATYGRSTTNPALKAEVARQLEHALVEMIVTLAESRITTGDLLGLRVGDIITTDKDIREPLEVAVEGAAKFQATPGAFKGRKAIAIQSPPQPAAG